MTVCQAEDGEDCGGKKMNKQVKRYRISASDRRFDRKLRNNNGNTRHRTRYRAWDKWSKKRDESMWWEG